MNNINQILDTLKITNTSTQKVSNNLIKNLYNEIFDYCNNQKLDLINSISRDYNINIKELTNKYVNKKMQKKINNATNAIISETESLNNSPTFFEINKLLKKSKNADNYCNDDSNNNDTINDSDCLDYNTSDINLINNLDVFITNTQLNGDIKESEMMMYAENQIKTKTKKTKMKKMEREINTDTEEKEKTETETETEIETDMNYRINPDILFVKIKMGEKIYLMNLKTNELFDEENKLVGYKDKSTYYMYK